MLMAGVAGAEHPDRAGHRARRDPGRGNLRFQNRSFGLSLDTLKEARWQKDRDLFVQRATELGARVDVQSANSDDNQQIRNVESLLNSPGRR